MTDRPILFSGPMVRALLDGRKTQTRRVIRDEWWRCLDPDDEDDRAQALIQCPFGGPGDKLWVRETWCEAAENHRDHEHKRQAFYRADCRPDASGDGERCRQDYIRAGYDYKWKPSIFMPRWASRITLDVVKTRVERLRDISAKEILAEGAVERRHDDGMGFGPCPVSAFDGKVYLDLISLWAAGWDGINGKRAPWASNPWVWVVEFRILEGC